MPVPYPPNAAGYPSLDIVSTTLVVESKAQGKQPSEYPVEIVATEPCPPARAVPGEHQGGLPAPARPEFHH